MVSIYKQQFVELNPLLLLFIHFIWWWNSGEQIGYQIKIISHS